MKNVRFLMLFVFALIGLAANGESSETKTFREEIDEIFSEFDKEQVPTGILSEYGVALVYPDNFDGGEPNDSNWVDAKTWELLMTVCTILKSIQKAVFRLRRLL